MMLSLFSSWSDKTILCSLLSYKVCRVACCSKSCASVLHEFMTRSQPTAWEHSNVFPVLAAPQTANLYNSLRKPCLFTNSKVDFNLSLPHNLAPFVFLNMSVGWEVAVGRTRQGKEMFFSVSNGYEQGLVVCRVLCCRVGESR